MSFKRNIETFNCEVCGKEVIGNGYTNHCPHCLWSKHVDNEPGDRECSCKGLMKPVSYEKMGDKERIIHQCSKCGEERPNKMQVEDNRDELIKILSKRM